MSLDREDLAARFFASLLTKDNGAPRQLADFAAECADALIARLRPATVAPVADAAPRPEWVPKVGERVEINDGFGSGAIFGSVKRLVGDAVVVDVDGAEYYRTNRRKADAEEGRDYVEPCAAPAPSPAASPAPYVPKVGDVVGIDFGKEYGATRVVTKVDGDDVSYVRLNTIGAVICRHAMKSSLLTYLRPATAAERAAAGLPPVPPDHPKGGQGAEGDQRVAAGLDAPAVDREGLAKELYESWGENAVHYGPFGPSNAYYGKWLRAADAAIAFLKANGGAK